MYYISDNQKKLNTVDVRRLLKQTDWAKDRTAALIEKSMQNSLCFGVYSEETDELIAFSRVITDYATFYYICDVIVDSAYRRHGIGKAMVQNIVKDDRLKGLRGTLATQNAHTLYEKYGGFSVCDGRYMFRQPE